jgi:hypothetical protein
MWQSKNRNIFHHPGGSVTICSAFRSR